MRRIRGGCGDEYRRAPFLTAAGDLSDHLRHGSQLSATQVGRCVFVDIRVGRVTKLMWECGSHVGTSKLWCQDRRGRTWRATRGLCVKETESASAGPRQRTGRAAYV